MQHAVQCAEPMQRGTNAAESGRGAFPIPQLLNLLIIAGQLAAMFAIFYGASIASAWLQVVLLAAAFAIVGNSVYSIIHEAEHRMLHSNPRVNDTLGTIMALFFPAPYHLIRHGHLCHHRFNRSDHEAFDLYFEGDLPVVKWIKFYGIITGVYWVTVAMANIAVLVCPFLLKRKFLEFDQPIAEFVDSLDERQWRLIRIEALLAVALHTSIVLFMGIPLLNYFLVYFGFGFSWSAMQYVHHFGTERHVLRGTRNLWLFAPVDLLWLHHNWHLTHHQQPTVPWLYLRRLGRAQDPHREFLVWHYLRMWRGPRYTDEHVRNRYLGDVAK
jgi:fatty acid desaturase